MLFMSSAQVLSKGLSTALLALTSLPSLGIYLLADMALFIGYKLWMGDFIYHEFSFDDNDKNLLVVLLSLLMRIGAKLVRSTLTHNPNTPASSTTNSPSFHSLRSHVERRLYRRHALQDPVRICP
jgi:hypothetical protein